jgi:hypothetical protein
MKQPRTSRFLTTLRHLTFAVAALVASFWLVAAPVYAADTTTKPGDPPPIDAAQRRHLALEGIYYIDNACPSGTTTASDSTAGGGGGGGDNGGFKPHVKAAYQFFISHGWSSAQSAGIVGNLMQESGSSIDPKASDGVAHGIAQWQGGRLQPMWSWVSSWSSGPEGQKDVDGDGKKDGADGKDSFVGQLNYLEYDLTHGHSSFAANYKKQSEARAAANYWNRYYEVSADTSSTRGDNATKVFNAAQAENWAAGITVVPEPSGQATADAETDGCGTDGSDEAGSVSGANCKSIGEKSDDNDPRNPYQCNSSQLKCDAGTDAGVGAAYADGKPYKIRLCNVNGVIVNAFVAVNIDKMMKAAKADGIKLNGAGGGFRTMDRQIQVRRNNSCPADHLGPKDANGFYNQATLIKNKNDTAPTSRCSPAAAPPGFSNHQFGMAVDWSYNGSIIGSHSNKAFQWMASNAKTYGFYNFPAEPWHWSVNGG